jgi:hypothetical protein
MSSAYEANFHKVVRVEELPFGQPKEFRAAGTIIVLRRSEAGVAATDTAGRTQLPTRVENGEVWVCIDPCLG